MVNQRVLQAARLLVQSGVSVIPIKAIDPSDPDDKGKEPALITWKEYQSRLPTDAELDRWFNVSVERGLAMIGGTVSGNLEFIDFDEVDIFDRFVDTLPRDLRNIVNTFPLTLTPTGCTHAVYRCEAPVEGPQKLARTLGPDGKLLAHGGIETKGEGGYVVAPPSPACVHPAGKRYELARHALVKLPVISAEARAAILDACRAFNQYVPLPPWEPKPRVGMPRIDGSLKPGEDYNNRRGEVHKVLSDHGWRMVIDKGEQGSEWLRPGKSRGRGSGGLSSDDGFICFSSSVPEFEINVGYSPFDVYTRLEHGGDYAAAARQLGKEGYGSPPGHSNTSSWSAGTTGYGTTNGHRPPAPTGEWPAPRPLGTGALPVFPLHVLPPTLRLMVKEVARVGAVPIDMVVMTIIQVIAAATRGRVKIQVGQIFDVHTNTFGVAIAEPSEHKSFVLGVLTAPLRQLETQMRVEAKPRVVHAQVMCANIDNRVLGLRNQIKNNRKLSPVERQVLEEEILELELSKPGGTDMPQVIVDDCNTTSLAAVMAAQEDNSAALLSDEGGFFDMLVNGEGKNDFDFILKAANQEPTRVNRISRGYVDIPKPALTIMLMVQPTVIEALSGTKALRGKGLLSRFLYCYPQPSPFIPLDENDMIDPGVMRDYAEILCHLFSIVYRGTEEKPEWHRVQIAPWSAGMRIFKLFSDEIQMRHKDRDGDLYGVSDWAGKLAGHTARLAGLLHLLRYRDIREATMTEIGEEDMNSAIEIGRYLIPHAQKVYGHISQSEEDKAGAKMLKEVEYMNRPQVAASDLATKFREMHPDAFAKTVFYLCKCGYLRPIMDKQGFYDVNPTILKEITK